jgi:hypothetical protein
MAASLLESNVVPNATAPKTPTDPKNQVESATTKVLFFNKPEHFTVRVTVERCLTVDANLS